MDIISPLREAQGKRDGLVLVHRLQEPQASRPGRRQSHEGQAPGEHDGSQGHAVRRQAHDLRRLQSVGGPVKPFETSRVFDAPRDKVWKAWTETDRLKQWWGPAGFKVHT